MSVRLADRSFQYLVGIAENILVKVGKFTFPADFVILEMEEDSKVPLILGRPFLHTADAYRGLVDEILEEDFDVLLDEGSKILHSIEGTLLEEEIFSEFIAMTKDENSESESVTEEPPFEKITVNTDYKIKTSLKEPLTDFELKPLPDNLEYVFLEEPSFLPVIILSQLSAQNKSKLAEAQALPTNDAHVVITFLKKLFYRFGMPKALISDRGTHFCNKIMEKTMKRYGVNHRFSTSYHPQTSGQVENTNRALKRILEKTVKDNPAIWSRKLDDALWAFRTAYKTPTGLEELQPKSHCYRYVGPFKVLEKVGEVAYKLELPEELSRVHNTFHVSNLKKCHADEPLAVPLDGLHLDDKLHFVEEPLEIVGREVKRLKRSRIPLVKVRWNSKRGPEFTWEREDQFEKKYPHLFTKTTPSSSAAL
ncbi:reverse transcriptase domain-containing protein [Tanacetum coccineum]